MYSRTTGATAVTSAGDASRAGSCPSVEGLGVGSVKVTASS